MGDVPLVFDLFAGAGGVDLGLRRLGLDPIGVEHNVHACATRAAAGLRTIRADLNTWLPNLGARVDGLWASPPCQDFSVCGKNLGRTGDRGRLVDIPPLWVDLYRPRWIVCEEVPPVLPIWHEHAAYYRTLGYHTWAGILNAADYGLPQARERAFLFAALDSRPGAPVTTHARRPHPTLFGDTIHPWVTVAQALGWTTDLYDRLPPRIAGVRTDLDGRIRSAWVFRRPAPTLLGAATLSSPGSIGAQMAAAVDLSQWPCDPYAAVPPVVDVPWFHRQADELNQPGPVIVNLEHALILQGFPIDHPVQGTKGARFLQVGNAVPPPLAEIVCRQFVHPADVVEYTAVNQDAVVSQPALFDVESELV